MSQIERNLGCCLTCGAERCKKCGECNTFHNEDPVDNCPGTEGNPRPALHPAEI